MALLTLKIFNGTNFFSIISSAALEISLKSSMRSSSKESYLQYAVWNPPAHTGARRWIEDSPYGEQRMRNTESGKSVKLKASSPPRGVLVKSASWSLVKNALARSLRRKRCPNWNISSKSSPSHLCYQEIAHFWDSTCCCYPTEQVSMQKSDG